MNSTYFNIDPYVNMASDAMMSASNTLNMTAQDFLVNKWPIWMNHTTFVWNRFQADPNNWIALYPLTLIFFAIMIWSTDRTRCGRTYKDDDDMSEPNIFVRRHRFIIIDEMPMRNSSSKSTGNHPMLRRSQGRAAYYMLD